MKQFLSYLILFLTIVLSSCFNNKPLVFYKFEQPNLSPHYDSSKWKGITVYSLSEVFFIENFRDAKKADFAIDNFVKAHKPKGFDSLYNYSVAFYKVSDVTNKEFLASNPREFYRYSTQNDLIWDYRWISGKLTTRWKYKDGEIINDPELGEGFDYKMITDSL